MNILITGAWPEAKKYISFIESQGHHVSFMQNESDSLPCEYYWVEGIIGNGIFLSHSIEKFTNLQYIQLTSAGFDRIPMDFVSSRNIVTNNARGVYSIPMAEYAVAGVLNLYKEQRSFLEKQRKHIWEKNRTIKEIYGQHVCIVGCGSVGTECAKRFAAFGSIVIGIDPYIKEQIYFDRIYNLDLIKVQLSQSDVVILTLPLTKDTYHMFDMAMFEAMKPEAVFVNIARGALVDTEALIHCLRNKLAGAILDVFEEEPLKDSVLWDMDKVIITPHNSFVGSGNNERLSKLIISNLEGNI